MPVMFTHQAVKVVQISNFHDLLILNVNMVRDQLHVNRTPSMNVVGSYSNLQNGIQNPLGVQVLIYICVESFVDPVPHCFSLDLL